MKRIKFTSLLVLAGALAMTSCGPTNEPTDSTSSDSEVVSKVEIKELTITSSTGLSKLYVGETLQLKVEAKPTGANNAVTWSSSDESIATVDENGLVTGLTKGMVIICATSKENSNVKKEMALTIEDAPIPDPTEVVISSDATELGVGESITLTAKVMPETAKQKVVWSSSDESIATITNAGVVNGLKVGSVTITAKAQAKPEILKTIDLQVISKVIDMDHEKWDAIKENNHEEYVAARKDEVMKVKGTVLLKTTLSEDGVYDAYIANGKDGFFVKRLQPNLGELNVGQSYVIGGLKDYYNGSHGIKDVEYVKLLDEVLPTEETDITNLPSYDEESLQPYMSSRVFVSSGVLINPIGDVRNTSGYNFNISINDKKLAVRVNKKFFTDEEYKTLGEKNSKLLPGQQLAICGYMDAFGYGKHHTPQIALTSINDIVAKDLTDEEKVDLAINNIQFDTTIRRGVDKIDLPKTHNLISGVQYKYETTSSLINLTTGEVSHGEKDAKFELNVTAESGTVSKSKTIEMYVFAINDDNYIETAGLSFDTAKPANKYNCSLTKSGYKDGVVELEGHSWSLNNALIGCDESDRFEGKFSARMKSSADDNSITLMDPVKMDTLEFKVAAYGTKPLGSQIQISYAENDSLEFTPIPRTVSVNSYNLVTYRYILPHEKDTPVRIKIALLKTSGVTISIDSIRLLLSK